MKKLRTEDTEGTLSLITMQCKCGHVQEIKALDDNFFDTIILPAIKCDKCRKAKNKENIA